jgi:hypothetical protein
MQHGAGERGLSGVVVQISGRAGQVGEDSRRARGCI